MFNFDPKLIFFKIVFTVFLFKVKILSLSDEMLPQTDKEVYIGDQKKKIFAYSHDIQTL